jgi:hypothetical protein
MAIPDQFQPVEQLSDRRLLALASSGMPAEQTARLSELSARQKAVGLVGDEARELGVLLEIYSEGWLRRTDALVEAIRRGLMEATT